MTPRLVFPEVYYTRWVPKAASAVVAARPPTTILRNDLGPAEEESDYGCGDIRWWLGNELRGCSRELKASGRCC